MKAPRQLFISFEGIDGSGKDTQLARLATAIRGGSGFPFGDKYANVWLTREPTHLTRAGRLVSAKMKRMEVQLDETTRLFIEDRKAHSRMIRDTLAHSHVLTSRYDLSTLAYQGAQGADLDVLIELHGYWKDGGTVVVPDVTLVFVIAPKRALERIKARLYAPKECFETLAMLERVHTEQMKAIVLLRKMGRTIIVINADRPEAEVSHTMMKELYSCI